MDIAKDPVAQANVARHLAALANHGGGYLLFGFRDNRAPKETEDPE
jgi:predicted HTH transcriptional regulator